MAIDDLHLGESPFYVDETGWTHIDRLKDGRVMCCICYEFMYKEDLEPVSDEPGKTWDVCKQCADDEKANGAAHY